MKTILFVLRDAGDRLLWYVVVLLGATLPVTARAEALPFNSRGAVLPVVAVQQVALLPINPAAELATDAQAGNTVPLRFAVAQPVTLTPTNSSDCPRAASGDCASPPMGQPT